MLVKEFFDLIKETHFSSYYLGRKDDKNIAEFQLERFGKDSYGISRKDTFIIEIRRKDGYSKKLSFDSFDEIDQYIFKLSVISIDKIQLFPYISTTSYGAEYIGNISQFELTVLDSNL